MFNYISEEPGSFLRRDWMHRDVCTRKHTSDPMIRYTLDVPSYLRHTASSSRIPSSRDSLAPYLFFIFDISPHSHTHTHTHTHTHSDIPSPVVQWPLSVSAPTELSPGWTSPAARASLCPSSSLRSESDWSTGRSQRRDKEKGQTSEEEETRWMWSAHCQNMTRSL